MRRRDPPQTRLTPEGIMNSIRAPTAALEQLEAAVQALRTTPPARGLEMARGYQLAVDLVKLLGARMQTLAEEVGGDARTFVEWNYGVARTLASIQRRIEEEER